MMPPPASGSTTAAPKAQYPPGRTGSGRRLTALLLIHLGFGGMLLSSLWDVLYKGRTFDPNTFGPFKALGILAGAVMMLIGLMVLFLLGTENRAGRDATGRPPALRERQPTPDAPRPDGVRPGAALQQPPPEDNVLEALPVVEGIPVAPGSEVLEAIPVETERRAPPYRPSNKR